ncbi:DapA-like protein, partial [Pavlovales sp. CCMP2436]
MSTRGDGLPCGSLVALITPMQSDGSVDEHQLRELLQWHIECGTDGLVVLGTTGEASTLSSAERTNVLRITQEMAVGKLPVIIGTGAIKPGDAIKMGLEAAEYGASGVLVVTPYYVKPTQKGLIKHFEQIADNSPLPIVLYNVPGRTGVDMTPITIGALSLHPRIVGVK